MSLEVSPQKAFLRDLKKLSSQDRESAIDALKQFVSNPKARKLNFELVRTKRDYHTIRATYGIRILMKQTGPRSFDVVAIGNHDYVYKSYFRK